MFDLKCLLALAVLLARAEEAKPTDPPGDARQQAREILQPKRALLADANDDRDDAQKTDRGDHDQDRPEISEEVTQLVVRDIVYVRESILDLLGGHPDNLIEL